jgi:hypothetical protein
MNELFSMHCEQPAEVLIQQLDGESVLLNTATGKYFGLDQTGSRIWNALVASASIQEAYEAVLDQYQVEPAQLLKDVADFVQRLMAHGLVKLHGK